MSAIGVNYKSDDSLVLVVEGTAFSDAESSLTKYLKTLIHDFYVFVQLPSGAHLGALNHCSERVHINIHRRPPRKPVRRA